MMDREEAIEMLKALNMMMRRPDGEPISDVCDALDMAIEALSQPNYETDTEVRLAVTNRKKEKVILWDAYGEVEYYPIEALSANCTTEKPNDTVEQKNDVVDTPTDLISRADAIKAIESRQTEQWIDADIDYNNGLESAVAEIKALPSADRPTELLKDGTLKVNVKSGAEVNRVLVWGDDGSGGLYYADDRPSGEWEYSEDFEDDVVYTCTNCGEPWVLIDGTPQENNMNYCPNCGAKMGGNK